MPIAYSYAVEEGVSSLAEGIWTAVSGANAKIRVIDTVSNNLANVDTLAFKKDRQTFKEYLTVLERDPNHTEIPRGPITDKEFYPLDGRDQTYVVNDGTYTNFKQGNLKVTKSPLDIALEGPGFLEVNTPYGSRLTRQGSLKVNSSGQLVTLEGYQVLASKAGGLASAQPDAAAQSGQGRQLTQGGVAIEQNLARVIQLPKVGSNVFINELGEIHFGDQLIAKLNIVEVRDRTKLRKQGDRLFESTDPNNVNPVSENTTVHQGMLETSNVNPVEEMANLIKAHRGYEADLKSIRTYDSLMGKVSNDLGKL